MGSGPGGGYRNSPTLHSNIQSKKNKYGFSAKANKFGVTGHGKSRTIVSDNPDETAKQFFKDLGAGGEVSEKQGGYISIFKDGSTVFYRPTSSSGSPAVNIKLKGANGIRYKIHFEPTGWAKD